MKAVEKQEKQEKAKKVVNDIAIAVVTSVLSGIITAVLLHRLTSRLERDRKTGVVGQFSE
jgi:hypothetical protein